MAAAEDQLRVSVRLPSDDFVEVSLEHSARVTDLRTALVSHRIGLKENNIHLLSGQKVLLDSQVVADCESESGIISLEALVDGIDDANLRYDEFIDNFKLSTLDQSLDTVSVEAYFTFRFKVNVSGLALFLPALKNSDCIHSFINDTKADRMLNTFGEEEAARRGFRRWSDDKAHVLLNRVHLVEVTDPSLEYDSANCRYDSMSALNAGYCLGDGSSWQRYTTSPPRPCMLHVDPLEYLLRIVPLEPLEYDSYYAIVFQNGVPCPPDSELDGPLLGFTHSAGVRDDKLYFFSTEKKNAFSNYC